MANKFLQALHAGRVLLMDGAMGSELQRAGIKENACYEEWNLTQPDRVQAIHTAYVQAGAEVLLTNTFQANPVALAKHDLGAKLEALSQAAVGIARKACGQRRFVLGDIGPVQRGGEELSRMAEALAGVDGLLLETLSDPRPVHFLTRNWSRKQRDDAGVVLASFTFCRNPAGELCTIEGLPPEAVANEAAACGVHALGVNCGRDISMDDVIAIVRRYRTVTQLPLFARPNAGTPTRVDSRTVYAHTPEQMADKVPELLEAGVAMVGGCCGTTPAHIAAFRCVIDEWNAKKIPETSGG
jgi:5-methyltetrahydrofolate--homocysteine methyltransferase